VKRGFTIIEVLVVITVIALLMSILVPALAKAREQAKILVVDAELKNISLALKMYAMDNKGKFPPTRWDCQWGLHFEQLPKELVRDKYLPSPPPGSAMAAGMEDRFNPGYTYKYRAVGEVIIDRDRIDKYQKATLWIPDGFPDLDSNTGKNYDDPKTSPVTWVLYSRGPGFDDNKMGRTHYPVPRETWYSPKTRTGVITRMRLLNGYEIGSFSGRK